MGVRFQKRVSLGKGLGLNVSKSGVSTSIQTKYGSISPRGFSIRTGIPGLSFRSNLGKGKNKNGGAIIVVLLIVGVILLGGIILWNLALLLKWGVRESINAYRRYRLRKQMALAINTDDSCKLKNLPDFNDRTNS